MLRSMLMQSNTVSFPFTVWEIVEMGRAPWARTPQYAQDAAAIANALDDHAQVVRPVGVGRGLKVAKRPLCLERLLRSAQTTTPCLLALSSRSATTTPPPTTGSGTRAPLRCIPKTPPLRVSSAQGASTTMCYGTPSTLHGTPGTGSTCARQCTFGSSSRKPTRLYPRRGGPQLPAQRDPALRVP